MTYVRSAATTPASVGVPLDNLVAFVDMGDENSYEGTGTSVNDFVGNLTAGTISGNTSYADGAMNFDGVSGAVTFTKGTSADNIFSGGGAIMVFFRPRSDGELNQGELVNTGYDGSGYTLFTENELAGDGGSVRITFSREFSSNDGIWDVLGEDDINVRIVRLDSWNSFAVVYDDSSTANTPTFFLNGRQIPSAQVQVTQVPTGTAVSDAGNSLILGNRAADDHTYDGQMDVFLMWDTAVDAETISTAHTAFARRHGSQTGVAATVRKGSDIFIYAGDYRGTSGDDAGAVFIAGGSTGSTINSSEGGRVEIRGGNTDEAGGGAAGVIIAVGGYGDQDANTHTVGDLTNISSEFGGVTLTAGNSGNRTLFRGTDNTGTGIPGDTIVRGGDCYDGSGNDVGGDIAITSGQGRNGSPGGLVLIRSRGPSGTSSTTGGIRITTQQSNDPNGILGAQGGSFTDSGSIVITTSPVGVDASSGGDITITAASTAAVTGNDPGSVTITAGSMNRNDQSSVGGRDVTITAGTSQGLSSSPGGSVSINSGAQSNVSSTSDAGDILLTCGLASGSGRDGKVIVNTQLCVLGSAIEATVVETADATAASADPLDLRVGTSDTGFNGSDLTLTSGSGDTDGNVNLRGETIVVEDQAGTATVGGFLQATSFDVKLEGKSATASSGNPGHSVTIEGGAGDGAGDGGSIVLQIGVDGGTGTDGRVVFNDNAGAEAMAVVVEPLKSTLQGFDATVAASAGAAIEIAGGDGLTTGAGGDVTVRSGTSPSGTDGRVILATDTVEPQPSVSVEFAILVPLPASGDGNDFRMRAAPGTTTNDNGGNLVLQASASGGGTGVDGEVIFRDSAGTRETRATWTAGNFGFLAPDGTASGVAGSSLQAIAGSGGGGNSDGGDITLQVGALTGTGTDGRIVLNASSGSESGSISPTDALLVINGLNGQSGGDAGVDIEITAGDGNTTGAAGGVTLTSGDTGTGTPAGVTLITHGFNSSADGAIKFRTQTGGFTGTTINKFTSGSQDTVTLGGGTADLVTLGSLTVDGRNMKFNVYVTVQNNATASDISTVVIEQTAYRSASTVTLLTAHRSDQQGNGTMNTDLSFALVVSTNDVLLRVTNASSSASYTVNTAVSWETQEGGFSS